MPQKHYAPPEISHTTHTTAPEPTAIALPDYWAQPDFKFGDTVKTNDESYIVIGLVMDTDLDIWKYLCRSRDIATAKAVKPLCEAQLPLHP